ncbi:MAG: pyrimidine-nucleoside phosphorylase [Eubacteriales bacterium]
MKMTDIIMKKRDGETLTESEIKYFVDGYSKDEIPDYQAAAFLMACYFNELSHEETKELTEAMTYSGDVIDLSAIEGVKADKHSTGGVADTTTLVLAPLVAACGLKLAKMSGRGLGHTGGTLDKLESIPGVSTALSMEAFIDQVNDIGVAVMGQTMSLCPADKKMYALRDVTATVDNIPLIASSIMSKKLAAGADVIVLDVKTGSGAFMKTLDDAKRLARTMVEIGKLANKKTVAMVTDMNQSLGRAVGNAMEVMEAVEILRGEREGDLKDVALNLASHLLILGKKAENKKEAYAMLQKAIDDGSGIKKLKEIIKAQGGDERAVDDFSLFDQPKIEEDYLSQADGVLAAIDTEKLGMASSVLGAGRAKKEDAIDYAVGIWVEKRLGESVKKGERLFKIYANDKAKSVEARKLLDEAVTIKDAYTGQHQLVYDEID